MHVKSSVPCEMVRRMSVTVSVGFTPVQFGFGHPAAWPDTVESAANVAGFVTNARFLPGRGKILRPVSFQGN